jgi:hypothetical protein
MHTQQGKLLRHSLDSLMEARKPIVISRHYDFTPMKFDFGDLQQRVMPHARYYRLVDSKWTALTHEELGERGGRVRFGVLECMTQTVSVYYPGEHGPEALEIHVPPLVASSSAASCLFTALEKSVPQLNLEGDTTANRACLGTLCLMGSSSIEPLEGRVGSGSSTASSKDCRSGVVSPLVRMLPTGPLVWPNLS